MEKEVGVMWGMGQGMWATLGARIGTETDSPPLEGMQPG